MSTDFEKFAEARVVELEKTQDRLLNRNKLLGEAVNELTKIVTVQATEFNKFRKIVMGLHNYIDTKFPDYGQPFKEMSETEKE